MKEEEKNLKYICLHAVTVRSPLTTKIFKVVSIFKGVPIMVMTQQINLVKLL